MAVPVLAPPGAPSTGGFLICVKYGILWQDSTSYWTLLEKGAKCLPAKRPKN